MWEYTAKLMYIDIMLGWQAYDQHLNMILGDVEETVTTIELDEETFEEIFKVCGMMYASWVKIYTHYTLDQLQMKSIQANSCIQGDIHF